MNQSIILAALIASTTATQAIASCNDLPAATANVINSSAHEYATSGRQSLDENGIVLFDYETAYANLGKWPNPFFNARYAHALYRDWLLTDCADNELRSNFLQHAEWFIDTAEREDGISVWTYPFVNDHFNAPAGWYSGIGQSQIAGVLFRAYYLTGDEKFKVFGQEALEVYFRSLSEGGIVTENGPETWIQEVPIPHGEPANILNGHITGALALDDVAAMSGEEERVKNLVRKAIDTVRHALPRFDAGFTSFYSEHLQDGKLAQLADRRDYNSLHVVQLMTLYDREGDPVFLDWAMRFQAYDDINDIRTAKGSSDAEKHGPDEAAGWMGLRYWSHWDFPTWYQIDFEQTLLRGVYLEGRTEAATPKDFTISTSLNGVVQRHGGKTGNTDLQYYMQFDQPVLADSLKIDIASDNGNKNVAMVAIMPVREVPERGAVADSCNHRTRSDSYALWDAFDKDPNTSYKIYCDGYIILPPLTTRGTLTVSHAETSDQMPVSVSEDLKSWRIAGSVSMMRKSISIPAGHYVRVSTPKSVGRLDGIQFEPSGGRQIPLQAGIFATNEPRFP